MSDKKIAVSAGGTTVDYYTADVTSASDYAPFGMQLVGRVWNSSGYRYGFNGKENDNEVKEAGNQQDYGMRIYDPRVGRLLSVDPITKDYPELTPYQFASNRPIDGIDLDGKEWTKSQTTDNKGNVIVKYEIKLKVVDKNFCADQPRLNQIAASTSNTLATAFNESSKSGVKYEFSISFEKVESIDRNKDYGVIIDNNYASEKSINGNASGNTQVGRITLATSSVSKYGMSSPGGKKKTVIKETPKDPLTIGVTLAHELLHTARLAPSWKERISDIRQYNPDGSRSSVTIETIKENLMNSLANKPGFQSTGTQRKALTTGQVECVDKVVDKEQKKL